MLSYSNGNNIIKNTQLYWLTDNLHSELFFVHNVNTIEFKFNTYITVTDVEGGAVKTYYTESSIYSDASLIKNFKGSIILGKA